MTRGYGQFCGLARALELVGGRWALLIVRELLTGPKRFTELEQGLRGIPTNILSSRLRELEESGLVERKLLAPASSSVVYGLTPYGLELEEPVVRLGLWGSKSLGEPTKEDFFSLGALAIALRAAFHPEKAPHRDLLFEIRIEAERLFVSLTEAQVSFPAEPSTEPHETMETAQCGTHAGSSRCFVCHPERTPRPPDHTWPWRRSFDRSRPTLGGRALSL